MIKTRNRKPKKNKERMISYMSTQFFWDNLSTNIKISCLFGTFLSFIDTWIRSALLLSVCSELSNTDSVSEIIQGQRCQSNAPIPGNWKNEKKNEKKIINCVSHYNCSI